MKRVLVTGATGFVGRQVLEPLQDRGFEVHGLSRGAGLDGWSWHQADLLKQGAAARVIDEVRPTHLVHLAWYTEHGRFWTAPENDVWVRASLELLEAFAASGGERLVIAGTCAEYEWGDGPLRESSTPVRPANPYGRAKDKLRREAERRCEAGGMSLGWGRLFFLFGPHEDPRRLVASVAKGLIEGKEVPCTDGEQRRDFLSTVELGSALATFLDSSVEGPVNIASGTAVCVAEVIGGIAAEAGREDLVRLGALARPEGDPQAIEADVGRLQDEVGWRPSEPLEPTLRETVRWWNAELTSPAP